LRKCYDAASTLGKKVHMGGPSSLPPPKVPCATLVFTSTATLHFDSNVTPDKMSRASQITLATTCIGAIGIVAAVHYGQKIEKAVRL
jgi:hypothetical protein